MDAKINTIIRRFASLSFTLGAVFILVSILLNVSHQTAGAVEKVTIDAKALNDHECNSSEWHFVINQIEDESLAPNSIQVVWANGDEEDVPLEKFTGGTAHYTTTSNLDSTVTSATAEIYPSWEDGKGQFNLSHGPCGVKKTNTPTSTNTPTDTPTSTPTDTPTSTPTDTPTSTPTDTPTPTPTDTPTNTPTSIPTDTPTPTSTGTITNTPTSTSTNTPTDTPTSTPTNTPTNTPSGTLEVVTEESTPTSTATATRTRPGPPIVPPGRRTDTPTPTAVIAGPVPLGTLPPPARTTPRFRQPEVIPVTGAERMPLLPQGALPQQIFLNVGIGLVSVALVLFGVARKFQ